MAPAPQHPKPPRPSDAPPPVHGVTAAFAGTSPGVAVWRFECAGCPIAIEIPMRLELMPFHFGDIRLIECPECEARHLVDFPPLSGESRKILADALGPSDPRAMPGDWAARFVRHVDQLRRGGGPLHRSLFEKIAPDILRDLQRCRTIEDAFGIVLIGLRCMEKGTHRIALAAAAFGRSFPAILKLVDAPKAPPAEKGGL